MKCMKNEGLKSLTREEKLDLGQNPTWNEVWSEKEVFEKVRSQKESREIEKNEGEITLTLYIEIHNSQQIERYREVSIFKVQQIHLSRSYSEVSTAKGA